MCPSSVALPIPPFLVPKIQGIVRVLQIDENAEGVSMVEVAKGAGSRDVGHGNDQSCRDHNHRGCQNRRR
jgi:hypothetical protein